MTIRAVLVTCFGQIAYLPALWRTQQSLSASSVLLIRLRMFPLKLVPLTNQHIFSFCFNLLLFLLISFVFFSNQYQFHRCSTPSLLEGSLGNIFSFIY